MSLTEDVKCPITWLAWRWFIFAGMSFGGDVFRFIFATIYLGWLQPEQAAFAARINEFPLSTQLNSFYPCVVE